MLFILEVPLRAAFPGFRDLIHDWVSFVHWFAVFLAGFAMAPCRPVLDRARELRWQSLGPAMATTMALFGLFWRLDGSELRPPLGDDKSIAAYLVFCLLRMASVWSWLLVCVGFAAQHLNSPSKLLTYLNRAVYPMFCLHLPIIVAMAYLVVPIELSVAAKYVLITTATVLLTLASYEFIIRRRTWLGPFFGLNRGQHDR